MRGEEALPAGWRDNKASARKEEWDKTSEDRKDQEKRSQAVIYPAVSLGMYEDQDDTIRLQAHGSQFPELRAHEAKISRTQVAARKSEHKSLKLRVELSIHTLSYVRN